MGFSKITALSSDPAIFRTLERSHHPGEKTRVQVRPPRTLTTHSHRPLSLPTLTAQSYTTSHVPSVSGICLFWRFHTDGVTQNVGFRVWLLSFKCNVSKVHLLLLTCTHASLFLLNGVSQTGWSSWYPSIHQWMDIGVVCTLWPLWVTLPWTCVPGLRVGLFAFLPGVCVRLQLMSYVCTLC